MNWVVAVIQDSVHNGDTLVHFKETLFWAGPWQLSHSSPFEDIKLRGTFFVLRKTLFQAKPWQLSVLSITQDDMQRDTLFAYRKL